MTNEDKRSAHLKGRKMFSDDPFGYSTLAFQQWRLLLAKSGVTHDYVPEPSEKDLMSPVLWICHAQALADAARTLVETKPSNDLPEGFHEICHSQFHAIAIMLVAYSIETCLKALLILNAGVDEFISQEHAYKTHNLQRLADFIPDLTSKERAILQNLTHFSEWAGRYPTPGSTKLCKYSEIDAISRKHRITAGDTFSLASKIFGVAMAELDDPE